MSLTQKEKTALPNTCGEETNLPGVPSVGCVSSLAYRPHSHDGVAACVTASNDAVHIIGPNLDVRRDVKRDHALLTRTLWRIPPQHHHNQGAAAAAGRARTGASTELVQAQLAEDGPGYQNAATAEQSGALITSLVAFLVTAQNPRHSTRKAPANDDTVCVCCSWVDARGAHHVSALFFSLLAALAPSSTAAEVNLWVQAESLPSLAAVERRAGVLRLFFDPSMSPTTNAGRSGWVVTCSCYTLDRRSFTAADGAVPDHASSADTAVVGGGNTTAPPAPAASRGKGAAPAAGAAPSVATSKYCLAFVKVSHRLAGPGSLGSGAAASHSPANLADAEPWLDASSLTSPDTSSTLRSKGFGTSPPLEHVRPPFTVAEATEAEDVVPWMWRFRPGRLVTSFAVQAPGAGLGLVLAAAGTSDGRVYLITKDEDSVARRLTGPISDVLFVLTQPAPGEATARSRVVDGVLAGARRDSPPPREDLSGAVSLVALDTAGSVVILHGVNTGLVTTQTVADVPQFITLTDTSPDPRAAFVEATADVATRRSAASTKSFLDLSTLRRFFGGGGREPPRKPGARPVDAAMAASAESPSPHLSTTPITSDATLDTGRLRGGGGVHMSGHLLSRGLLCATVTESQRGGAELIVSTLGQVIVSIPFDPAEDQFAIAGFTVTPMPVNHVGFVDFFNTGAPELLITSTRSVLVAQPSRDNILVRAALLGRLLQGRGATGATATGAVATGAVPKRSVVET